jgi:hypothetical protein
MARETAWRLACPAGGAVVHRQGAGTMSLASLCKRRCLLQSEARDCASCRARQETAPLAERGKRLRLLQSEARDCASW